MASIDPAWTALLIERGQLRVTEWSAPTAYGYIEQTPEGWYWVHELHHPDGRVERFREYVDGLYEDNP